MSRLKTWKVQMMHSVLATWSSALTLISQRQQESIKDQDLRQSYPQSRLEMELKKGRLDKQDVLNLTRAGFMGPNAKVPSPVPLPTSTLLKPSLAPSPVSSQSWESLPEHALLGVFSHADSLRALLGRFRLVCRRWADHARRPESFLSVLPRSFPQVCLPPSFPPGALALEKGIELFLRRLQSFTPSTRFVGPLVNPMRPAPETRDLTTFLSLPPAKRICVEDLWVSNLPATSAPAHSVALPELSPQPPDVSVLWAAELPVCPFCTGPTAPECFSIVYVPRINHPRARNFPPGCEFPPGTSVPSVSAMLFQCQHCGGVVDLAMKEIHTPCPACGMPVRQEESVVCAHCPVRLCAPCSLFSFEPCCPSCALFYLHCESCNLHLILCNCILSGHPHPPPPSICTPIPLVGSTFSSFSSFSSVHAWSGNMTLQEWAQFGCDRCGCIVCPTCSRGSKRGCCLICQEEKKEQEKCAHRSR